MIKVAIVEDEKEYSDQFTAYLERFRQETHNEIQSTVFSNGMNFIDEYTGNFDIVLMDIAMPHMNGLEVAKHLRDIDGSVCLIFITTLAQYAIRGYEVDALDFLVKPVQYELFRLKLEKAFYYIDKATPVFYTIVTAAGMRKMRLSEIRYIESAKHYLIFHTAKGEHKMRGSMKEITGFFAANGFAHINSSLLVNLSYVDAIQGNEVTVENTVLPVARIYKSEFVKKLTTYLGGGADG